MDALKALVANKRKAVQDEFQGKKFARRSEIEDCRMRKLREEEEQERLAKVGVQSNRVFATKLGGEQRAIY